jgi:hypothetical protein
MGKNDKLFVLGKAIGESSGWDQTDLCAFMFYDVTLNDFGRSFAPKFINGSSLFVDYERGTVIECAGPSGEDRTELTVDWGIFNK